MAQRTATVQLAPVEEADRMWKGARKAIADAGEDYVSLTEALDLGIRAAEIYTLIKLRPLRNRYPATITSLLEESPPEISIERDAIHVPRAMTFLDIIDMLSEEGLSCVSRELHHGWEDPRFSCARSRQTSSEAVGESFDADARSQLLLLLACRNRIFRLPPPVAIPTDQVLAAFPTLDALIGRLRGDRSEA